MSYRFLTHATCKVLPLSTGLSNKPLIPQNTCLFGVFELFMTHMCNIDVLFPYKKTGVSMASMCAGYLENKLFNSLKRHTFRFEISYIFVRICGPA